jgi:hypothetical protein
VTTRLGGSWTLFLFLPHMTSCCVSITEQTTGKCNLFVKYNAKTLQGTILILNNINSHGKNAVSTSHAKSDRAVSLFFISMIQQRVIWELKVWSLIIGIKNEIYVLNLILVWKIWYLMHDTCQSWIRLFWYTLTLYFLFREWIK